MVDTILQYMVSVSLFPVFGKGLSNEPNCSLFGEFIVELDTS